jgi:arsenite methyltransferase
METFNLIPSGEALLLGKYLLSGGRQVETARTTAYMFSLRTNHKVRQFLFDSVCRIGAFILLASYSTAQDGIKRTEEELHHLHQDTPAYISFLEDPKRDAYQKPQQVIQALNLRQGEVVADIGAGSGYFSFRLAQHVGPTGRVYAVDVAPDMILHLNRKIRSTGVQNVVTILADANDPLLPDASVDRFFICDTWHHIEKQTQYLSLMKKMLKPGGQIVMIDFQKKELPVGPRVEMKIAREDLIRQMESEGFELIKEHTFLPYQYFLIFQQK